jgi:hypothetical protein
MKRFVLLAVFLLAVFTVSDVFAEEAKVTVLSTIPIKTEARNATNLKVGWETKALVIKIDDQKNGVVCFAIVSASEAGRAYDGGYPGTAISCVPSVQVKKR